MTWIHANGTSVVIAVHLQPRSQRVGVLGEHGGRLRIGVKAAPIDGAANGALIELLSKLLGVPKRAVEITGGHTSRQKVVLVSGITLAAARQHLQPGA